MSDAKDTTDFSDEVEEKAADVAAGEDVAPEQAEPEPPALPEDAVVLTIDGEEVVATKGELVIHAAERTGTYIPHFCYHPRMRPVGMCRMCIVDIDTGRGPALQPSCMIEVADGMVVDTQSAVTKKAQDGILEFLLVNHPLDCPVCDKGGECPLQDQTIAYGPGESRMVEEKSHWEKPIAISELVNLDRERCILCDRCTRFANEVAGDTLITFQERGVRTEVNTFPDQPFASYFSGNTVQICPVGALTSSPYRFKARPWDLEEVESTCTGCSVGCRIAVDTSRNEVLRKQGVDVDAVNWGWLCDRGRFGFQSIHGEARLAEPQLRGAGGSFAPARWSEALGAAAQAVQAALDAGGADALGVIGGARLTNEAAYAWAKLAKGVLGTDNVDAQLGDDLPAEAWLGVPRATIDQACEAGGTVVLLAPDLKENLPVFYLRLRHAVLNDGVKVVEVTPHGTGTAGLAAKTVSYLPGEVAQAAAGLEAAVAEVNGGRAPGTVTVVLGRPSLAESATTVLDALPALRALPGVRVLPALRRGNLGGATDLGLAPGLLPGRRALGDADGALAAAWPSAPSATGLDTAAMLQAAVDGRVKTLILLGADPVGDFPDRSLAAAAIEAAEHVIAVDTYLTESSELADVVLPAAGFAEVSGSFTNLEGRVTNVAQRVTAPGTARADWAIAVELAHVLGHDLGLESVEGIQAEIAAVSPAHAHITADALAGPEGSTGLLVHGDGPLAPAGEASSPPPTDTYSLRLVSSRLLYDAATQVQHSPSLAGLGRSLTCHLSVRDAERLGLEDGGRVRLTSSKGQLEADVVADPALVEGAVWVPFNQVGTPVNTLVDSSRAVTEVRVETA
jgi:NADH-quinone oxidoreductase subunit G